ncbi:MAG: glycine cleavage system aminomethyltransferase GcvT [Gammaproteobacteria bacterium]|nr:glycine cleavage system aminomethyltransferase GcvT [Gammaproteobacteria bacterium]
MGRRTPLYEQHQSLGARMVDFGGWDMPLHYGSQIEEHHAVRRGAGMFDVSHMCAIDLQGEGVRPFLERLLANDIGKLRIPGKALYTCMLNEAGGVIDDLIVYDRGEHGFRLVVNAGTRDGDLAWIRRHALADGAEVRERADLAMIAVQGPQAGSMLAPLLVDDARAAVLALEHFSAAESGGWFVARTGYTGEDGFEIVLPASGAQTLWRELLARGVRPCGLGARDTLRLEAGMNLHGNDMDEATSPLESGLGWTVAFDPAARDFIGRSALEAVRRGGGPERRLVGLLLEDRGILRAHQRVLVPGVGEGEVTSGSFSPTLERSIGLARVPRAAAGRVEVDVRGRLLAARIVKPPFVRHGKPLIAL